MRSHARRLLLAWLAWASLVLSHYYVQVWRSVIAMHVPSPADAGAIALPLLLVALGAVALRGRLFAGAPAQAPGIEAEPINQSRGEPSGKGFARFCLVAAVVTVPWLYLWPRVLATGSTLAVPGLPHFGEAAARLAVALVGASLTGAATLVAGAILLQRLHCQFQSRAEHLLFAAVNGVGVISYASLLLAVLGIYRPLSVALLIAAVLAAGVAVGHRIGAAIVPLRRMPHAWPDVPWLALAVVAVGYALVAALAPEKEYDALWYHLNLPRLWLDAGRPVDRLEEYVSLYPLTWELMFGAGLTLGGDAGAKLLHFACLPLSGILVWQAARRYMPGVSAAAAVAFFVTAPTVLWESSTAYVDLALALHAGAACYALARHAEQGDRGWRAIAALQFGVAAATKHLGVIVAVVALALYAVWAIQNGRRVRQTLRHALVIAFVAALVPSPWYARSWRASGNPVFPEMFAVFGASPPERWDAVTEHGLATFKSRFGIGRSPRDLIALPWDVTVHGALFGGALGPLFLILIPGFIFVRSDIPRAVPWLAAGVVGYGAVWASPISSYQLRFLVPVVPALALIAAAAFERLQRHAAQSAHGGPTLLATGVLILGALNLPPFIRFHEADRVGWNGWLTHVLRDSPVAVVTGRESARAYLGREVLSFNAWQWINENLPADARVLTTTGGDQFYARRARVPFDATIARPAVWSGAEELQTAVAALRRLGITHVLFDRRELSRLAAEARVSASTAFQHACTVEYEDSRFFVCRIEYGRLPGVRTAAEQ
jgi:4-amino-4-deoxy-L-arabinose transferase-like glycosyltransferase